VLLVWLVVRWFGSLEVSWVVGSLPTTIVCLWFGDLVCWLVVWWFVGLVFVGLMFVGLVVW